jgi:hypothetical protein
VDAVLVAQTLTPAQITTIAKAAADAASGGLHADRVIADIAALASVLYVAFSTRQWRKEAKVQRQESQRFLDVLQGVKQGPGIEERPSLVERTATIERHNTEVQTRLTSQDAVLQRILAEVTGTGPNSLASSVSQLNETMQSHLTAHIAAPQPRQRTRRPTSDPKDQH